MQEQETTTHTAAGSFRHLSHCSSPTLSLVTVSEESRLVLLTTGSESRFGCLKGTAVFKRTNATNISEHPSRNFL